MRIAILGAGNVGGTLGEAWARHGHEVYFGTRKPDSPEIHALLQRCGARARAESPADAVRAAEVVVNTLPWHAVRGVVEAIEFAGKPLLDATNPLKPDLSGLEDGPSAAERVALWARGSKVVKIFNTTGVDNMAKTNIGGHRITMLYCGDDAQAKHTAASLAHDIGFDPVDAGPLANAPLLESMAMLWIWMAIKGGMGRDFAFQLIKRS